MNKVVIFIPVFAFLLLDLCQGLRCYTCSYDIKDKESSLLCVTEPKNLTGNPIRRCLNHVKFCIIVRVESKQTGKVTSFLRKCEENPTEDADVDSTIDVSHFRSCTSDLCNYGDGLSYIDDGHESESVAILVPDRSSSAVVRPVVCLLFISILFSNGFLR